MIVFVKFGYNFTIFVQFLFNTVYYNVLWHDRISYPKILFLTVFISHAHKLLYQYQIWDRMITFLCVYVKNAAPDYICIRPCITFFNLHILLFKFHKIIFLRKELCKVNLHFENNICSWDLLHSVDLYLYEWRWMK